MENAEDQTKEWLWPLSAGPQDRIPGGVEKHVHQQPIGPWTDGDHTITVIADSTKREFCLRVNHQLVVNECFPYVMILEK